MEIKKENWFFCPGCKQISYKFDCCGNTACNGGGCDLCKDLWDEIWRLINNGEAPNENELVKVDDEETWLQELSIRAIKS